MQSSNILFVDSEISVLESIRRFLINENKNIYLSQSSEEALKLIKEKNIDILFVDITSGNLHDLLEKTQELYPSITKVVISDFTHLSKIINNIKKLNLHSFLLKPWKRDELLETLKSAEDYSVYLKQQETEKENLVHKNTIYQRIINFKGDIEEYNKRDISSIKTATFLLMEEYENLIKNKNTPNEEQVIKNLRTVIDLFLAGFPTFIERFTIEELAAIISLEEIDINIEGDIKSNEYIKNLELIKILVNRVIKYLKNAFDAKVHRINISANEFIRIELVLSKEVSNRDSFEHFVSFLFKVLMEQNFEASIDSSDHEYFIKFNF